MRYIDNKKTRLLSYRRQILMTDEYFVHLNNYLTRVRLSVSLSVCGHGPDIAPFAITCGPNRGE